MEYIRKEFEEWLRREITRVQAPNLGGNPHTGNLDRANERMVNKTTNHMQELLNSLGENADDQTKINMKLDEKYQKANRKLHRQVIASNTASFFTQLMHDAKNFYVELRNYEFDLYENLIQNASALITKKINISTQYYTNSLDTVVSTINGDIKNIGSQAASHQISLGKELWEYQREYGLSIRKMQNYASIAEQNFLLKGVGDFLLNTGQNIAVTASNFKGEHERYMNEKNGILEAEYSEDAARTVSDYFEFVRQEKGELMDLIELRKRSLNLDIEQQEKLFEAQKQLFERAEQVFKRMDSIATSIDTSMNEIDKSSKEFAKQFGFVGSQGQAWTNTMIDNNVLASRFAMKAEDLIHAQEAYFDNAGRAVNLNQEGGEDFTQMMALSRATGMDMGQIGSIMGDMNIFNTSVKRGADSAGAMFRLANRMGLSGRKFMKDLSQNLKLAQKYNFAGGREALQKMSVWSQQVRLNMQTAANFAEGIMDGGLESTLEKAARLQVLGGNAAIYSDPLGMMYDAGADVENLARRIEGMLGNYGTFNTKTGATTFSWTDDLIIRQIAKGLGMEPDEAKNVLREKNKLSAVRKQVDLGRFSTNEQRQISNRAVYDEESGEFKITMLNGTKKSVKDLTRADLEDIRSDNDTEALTQYAEKSLNVEQSLLAKTSYIAARMAQVTRDPWYEAKKIEGEIYKSHTTEMIELANAEAAKVWGLRNKSLESEYKQTYDNYKSGVYDDAMMQIEMLTDFAAQQIGEFGKTLHVVNQFWKNNDLEGYFTAMGVISDDTGSKNLMRVNDKAEVNYGRLKDGKKQLDSDISGLMGGWRYASEGDKKQYISPRVKDVEPKRFTAAHGYRNGDERLWVVQENNTSAVNLLTKAINSLSSVQIKSNADVKLNGSINLNGTNMKISADDLARDPEFMQQLVSLISKRIDLNNNGGKSNGRQPGVVRR